MTRWLQFLVGARYDSSICPRWIRTPTYMRNRMDEKISPRAAVIVKPMDNMSLYTAWSMSYLPASGDQFSALNPGTLILEPQKFESTEVGVKWNINPKLLFTAAIYEMQSHQCADHRSDGPTSPFPAARTRSAGSRRR